ncbi:Uncharacterized protein SCF082_LOCUS26411 [Durusdinium trenchii]|uniref:Uncharacterized protein n=1 Tax=Durusdinium trenchii TaxID=1381693 RepID=A0ABP0M8E6_9DINO
MPGEREGVSCLVDRGVKAGMDTVDVVHYLMGMAISWPPTPHLLPTAARSRQLEADLRSLGARVEAVASNVADVKARARDVEKSQLHCHELLQQRTSELQEMQRKQGRATCQALRLADAERQRQLEQLSRSCDSLAEARKGIVAEVDSCHSIDRQLEEAVRRLDGRVERASSLALQCSEGVADAKGFARELSEKVLAQCGELLENRSLEMKELLEQQAAEAISKMEVLKVSNNECHQQLDFLSRALAELSEARRGMFAEVESCQSSDRKLEESLRRMENRVERLSSVTTQCSEGLNEQKTLAQQNTEKAQLQCTELLELRIRELKEQLKHREELSSNTAKDWFGHVMWFGVTFDGVGELREKKGCPATLQPLAGTSHTTPSSVTAGWWFGSLN